MAKFELNIYDNDTEKVIKTFQRNKIPVGLFLKYQEFAEKLTSEKLENDYEMFTALKGLFLETFPALTADEYMNNTDTAEVLMMFNDVLRKATQISAGKGKNA